MILSESEEEYECEYVTAQEMRDAAKLTTAKNKETREVAAAAAAAAVRVIEAGAREEYRRDDDYEEGRV